MQQFQFFSSAVGHGVKILGHAGITITSKGDVMWSPSTHLEVWCNLSLDQWPNDMHTCELQLGFWSQDQFVDLLIAENETVASYFTHVVWQLFAYISMNIFRS